jgi:hypothetical protein
MLSLVSLLYGCGGGGLNLPNVVNPPNPNPPTGYRVTVTLNMNQVYEGEEVICRVELSPSVQQVINWRQEPSSPSGTFSPLSGSVVRWRAPMVERATSFSLIACVVIQGKSYEGSASVIVLDKSEPPQEPPRISISYPLDDGKQNLVGEGTLLTIMGNVQAGSNPIQKIQVLEGSNVLQEWPISSSGEFRIDLGRFGKPGQKMLKIRAVDSSGLYGEASIQVVNDDTVLDAQAREFLRKYCTDAYGKTIRFGNLTTGPYTVPVNVYLDSSLGTHLTEVKHALEEAEKFWERYTGIEFRYINSYPPRPEDPKTPVIGIGAWWDKEGPGGAVAITTRGSQQDVHELTDVGIVLYKGWLYESELDKIRTITHELGHCLVTELHTDPSMYDIMSNIPWEPFLWWPYEQKAVKILYSLPPGSQL